MGIGGQGRRAYEEADDPCFDDGEVGGEDGEPGHEGRRERGGRGCRVQRRCWGRLLHGFR